MVEEIELPTDWKIVRVKDVAETIQYGFTESSSKEAIGPKFLRITDIQENQVQWESVPYCKIAEEQINKYKLKDGDLVFARSGATVGKSYLIKGQIPEAIFASYLIRLRFSNQIIDKYVYNFFQSGFYWKQIASGQAGIGQPNVNGTKLGELFLPLAPIKEQQNIVSKIEELFSEVDKGIEEIKTAQQQLKVYRQAVLKSAFEGKLTHNEVQDDELPKGWRMSSIGELFEVFVGSTPSRKNADYWNGDIHWISSGEVAFNNINTTRERISKNGLENSSCKIHPVGTVIMAMIGEGKTRGQAAILKVEAAQSEYSCY
jgi:type I restriction enzyme S subunit